MERNSTNLLTVTSGRDKRYERKDRKEGGDEEGVRTVVVEVGEELEPVGGRGGDVLEVDRAQGGVEAHRGGKEGQVLLQLQVLKERISANVEKRD